MASRRFRNLQIDVCINPLVSADVGLCVGLDLPDISLPDHVLWIGSRLLMEKTGGDGGHPGRV